MQGEERQGGGDPNEPGLHMGIRRGGSEGHTLGIVGGSKVSKSSISVRDPPKAIHFFRILKNEMDCMERRGQGGSDPHEPGLQLGIRRRGSEGDPLGILGGFSAKMGDP